MHILKKLALHDLNRKGYSTKRKLVIIESDDWGSIRMLSKQSFEILKKAGVPVERSPYCKLDGLEKTQDLENLFSVLSSHKDQHGNNPKITLNYVVQNPDFQSIRGSEYKKYSGESIHLTFAKTKGCENMIPLIQQGIESSLIMPQFHGREHVQIKRWLDLLQTGRKEFLLAFELGIWGLSRDVISDLPFSIQATYDGLENNIAALSITEGLSLFRKQFGYSSETFIPNNYIWNPELNQILANEGVKHFQGMKYTLLSRKNSDEQRKKIRRVMGEMNSQHQTYGIRNCHFEPSEKATQVDDVLKEMNIAFTWNKPAIICSHRINYTSRMNEVNRDINLNKLNLLLSSMLKRWPEIEFISSPQLANLFHSK